MAGALRIGLLQFAPRLGEREANLDAIAAGLESAVADLFVLPELATSGYALPGRDRARALAERADGDSPGLRFLQALAEAKDAGLIVGMPLLEGEALYNAAALIRPGAPPLFYRKLHLFYREAELFAPGDRPPAVARFRGLRIGTMICFDWIFPEMARLLALAGADLIAHPSNLVLPGFAQAAMVTRCVENGVFGVTCNRVGQERYPDEKGALDFTGLSQVIDPRGRRLLQLDEAESRCAVLDIDPTAARDKWITPRNHVLDDRRPEHYAGLRADDADAR